MKVNTENLIKELVSIGSNRKLKYEPNEEEIFQTTIKERIKKFNHEHSLFSYLSVHFDNEGQMVLFFNQQRACLKVYEGKPNYFHEDDLKVIYDYGINKAFYNTQIDKYKEKGWDNDYLKVINK
ncbi:MAG: hypothetical protein K2W92_02760 [Alphaproteobacteria bacterium]|nr:hypothetical protein [Alphaproteobacteria bacterium]